MNASLIRLYSKEELERCPFLNIYTKYWVIVGKSITDCVLDFLNRKAPIEGWNKTYIALILKVKNPKSVSDFRPISLCNVIYKLIAKILTNWLKWTIGDIISVSQSAFVPGHLIRDNVMVSHEFLSYMNKTKKKKKKSHELLWKLKIHNKISFFFFIWRTCHNCIPTMVNLINGSIEVSPRCPLCRKKEKTVSHELFGCKRVRVIWSYHFPNCSFIVMKNFHILDIWRPVFLATLEVGGHVGYRLTLRQYTPCFLLH